MYEEITQEYLLRRMLDTARSAASARGESLDTREGSMLWYGSAPASVEAENLYIQLGFILNETFGDTASRPYLIQRAAERGLSPKPASAAVGRGVFGPAGVVVPVDTRFRLEGYYWRVTGQDEEGYLLTCETAGADPNGYTGDLIPVEYVQGLETAQLTEIVIPGEDEENTEAFRARYLASFDMISFGGNVADYLEKVRAQPGVGGVKVYAAWNGNINPADFNVPEGFDAWFSSLEADEAIKAWLVAVSTTAKDGLLTVGGAVRVIIQGADYKAPSAELIEQVQTALDPEQNHGEGLGLAPIGHVVTVRGVEEVPVSVTAILEYDAEWSWEAIRSYVEAEVEAYLLELSKRWQDESGLIVRVAELTARILGLEGVRDVISLTLNGEAQNVTLTGNQIPAKGEVHGA